MMENKKSCEAAFVKLRETADKFCAEFAIFEQKLSAANTALEYSLQSETVKEDLVTSCRELLFQNSRETTDQIGRIVSSLNSLAYKCSQLPALSKPYQNILSVYSSRMESAISSFEDKNKAQQHIFNTILYSVLSHETFQKMLAQLEAKAAVFAKLIEKYKDKTNKRLAVYQKEFKAKQTALETEQKRWKKRFAAAMVLSVTGLVLVIGIAVNKLTGPTSVAIQLMNEKNELQVKHTESERKYAALLTDSNKIQTELQTKNSELAALQARYNDLQSRSNALQTRNNELTARNNELAALQTRYNELQTRSTTLQARNNELQTSFSKLLAITSIRVGNWNNGWLTSPGNYLSASSMRYLMPRVSYNSKISGSLTLYVKLINPQGDLFYNSQIFPRGFSYSYNANIREGQNQTIDLLGWGNSDSSSYSRGTWTVEVWYEGVLLGSEKVQLN